jgi:hypothetical protein
VSARPSNDRVLVIGAYFADRENRVGHLSDELNRSRHWRVEQRWVALGDAIPPEHTDITVAVTRGEPKFSLVNGQLRVADAERYAYIVVADDDIEVPRGFLDDYLALVERHDLALAQPARTHDSYTDHHFVAQLGGISARQTRFVEIGPLFSMRADALKLLTPFDEESPMGWGYDLVWPVAMEKASLKMGIVDAVPVAHDLRKPVSSYSYQVAHAQMLAFLATRPHLKPLEAFHIVRSFS